MLKNGKLINKEVRIENTNRCNAHCIICSHDDMKRQRTDMPLGKFHELIIESRMLGAKTVSPFGFGEPLLDKTIADKVRCCTDLELDTFLTTNASLLTPDLAYSLLDAGLSHNQGLQAVDPGIIAAILICCTFGTAIG